MDCWVVFTISGDGINPELFTRHLGMEPNRIVSPTEDNDYKSLWQISSSLKGKESPEDHFMDILRRLLPVREKLKKFTKDAKLDFYCAVSKPSGYSEVLCINPEILSVIGHIGATLEIDFQITSGEMI
ncbi:MAG: DUF4279 domain-containing protein [Spirochaetia bacterium]|nr:DUF4279 domain-containing protein [Spirochaetia bacterium]